MVDIQPYPLQDSEVNQLYDLFDECAKDFVKQHADISNPNETEPLRHQKNDELRTYQLDKSGKFQIWIVKEVDQGTPTVNVGFVIVDVLANPKKEVVYWVRPDYQHYLDRKAILAKVLQ